MPRAIPLATNVWLLDLDFQGVPGTIAAYLYTSSRGHTLVETGPGSTLDALRSAVADTGARFEDITQLIVTHIHLDHAGAAGTLLRELPYARLVVHPVGAPHMIDPSKLLASATRIYGDAMDRLWGAFESCPADQVVTVDDDTPVLAGDHTLRVAYTPGHASHHIALYDEVLGSVITGDVAGVRLQGSAYVRPPTPPPDIDIAEWHTSIARLRALQPSALWLTHFGPVTDCSRHFDALLTRLDAWTDWVHEHATRGETSAEMAEQLRQETNDALRDEGSASLADGYEIATPSPMTVDGLLRYWKKRAS